MSRGLLMSRRGFLRGAGGITLALPLMPSLGCNRSDPQATLQALGPKNSTRGLTSSGFPKRLVIFYKPNGFHRDWFPVTGSETNFDLSSTILAPIAHHKERLLLLQGLDMAAHNEGPGEPHQQGMALLTGRPLNQGTMVGGDGTQAGWASGISLDQFVAQEIGGGNRFGSRQFGVQSTTLHGIGTEVRTVLSYAGPDAPIPNEDNPYNAMNSLFADFSTEPYELEKLRARRRSVLDAVASQFDRIRNDVDAQDRRKLDQHATAVRDIERRIESMAGPNFSCQVPTFEGSPVDIGHVDNYGAVGRLQMDLMVSALACDLTRVATIQWSAATNNRPYPFLSYQGQPLNIDEHVTGHEPDSNTDAWGRIRVINEWYAQQLRYLLDTMAAVPEGNGTLLDHSIVVVLSEITMGNTHSHMDIPFLLAGGAEYFRMGRMLNYEGTKQHNDLWVSLLNAMDIPNTTFGAPEFCNGPLSGLT